MSGHTRWDDPLALMAMTREQREVRLTELRDGNSGNADIRYLLFMIGMARGELCRAMELLTQAVAGTEADDEVWLGHAWVKAARAAIADAGAK